MMSEPRGAARFFWCWLIIATAMSVTGNVAHALLHAPAATALLAAGAALVPPVVLLAATHSVSTLVRARVGGAIYWAALGMTLALAACAFVLSFEALRSLAISLGLPTSIAWLWPCAIDVAIAQATLCLLSLSRRGPAAAPAASEREAHISGDISSHAASFGNEEPHSMPGVMEPEANRFGVGEDHAQTLSEPAEAALELPEVDEAAVRRWSPIAESIVREGVTSKAVAVVASILAQREAGMPPSTIGRTHRVHHTTVGRILSAADSLTG
ncbi:DUF2637 domain-containing protein [Mycolicibacterium sp. BiH015]|uniref:DUF2637 domain-containing protein n=1 Tax=Mycolicibacterium sp. BiH015 TaxID=3018808 RepID=UPI0022E38690|nr:DUF2637 domain-containing protein [Mycolicibacterium sp. BiH015]MDA2893362.1 DUF2637 domain-containing protein [Mycolicibacterium sp. BiH015]